MTHKLDRCTPAVAARPLPPLVVHLGRFSREESGVVTIFAMFMLMMMLLVGGIGVDLMRNEMERVRLQNTVDRAVLAAADLDQTLDPTAVVEDYFTKSGMREFLTSVTVDEGLNYRTVFANASTRTPTQFMQKVGVDSLPVYTRGTAEERIANVEISMVLDISGSMSHNSKMANMKNAAKEFVDQTIREETKDLVSLSIVPYTAQVNAGPDIFYNMDVDAVHDYSHCVEFDVQEFKETGLRFDQTYEQMQHFEESNSPASPITNPGCPDEDYERITPFSQDNALLKAQIDKLQPRANTSIHLGMKWGTAMLDPSFQVINQALYQDNGKIDFVFKGRPAAYSDPETLKTIVLLTDGENVNTRRIVDIYYATPSHYAHWARSTLDSYLNRFVRSNSNRWYYMKYTAGFADTLLDEICTVAKDAGIVVWTVGFEVSTHGANVMRSCASSPSHFFLVNGTEVTDAFTAIARQINQLRLTQ